MHFTDGDACIATYYKEQKHLSPECSTELAVVILSSSLWTLSTIHPHINYTFPLVSLLALTHLALAQTGMLLFHDSQNCALLLSMRLPFPRSTRGFADAD